MTKNGYLKRLKQRQLNNEVKSCAAFGIFLGSFLLCVSIWFWLFHFLPSEYVVFIRVLFFISCFLILSGIVLPQLLVCLKDIFNMLGNQIFTFIFKILLSFVYWLVVVPMSIFYKHSKDYSFLRWFDVNKIENLESWKDKNLDCVDLNECKFNNILIRGLSIVDFVIKKKQWVLIPTLLILIAIGLLFSFMQSSLVLPFIYSIF